jgi:hypothetical protein
MGFLSRLAKALKPKNAFRNPTDNFNEFGVDPISRAAGIEPEEVGEFAGKYWPYALAAYGGYAALGAGGAGAAGGSGAGGAGAAGFGTDLGLFNAGVGGAGAIGGSGAGGAGAAGGFLSKLTPMQKMQLMSQVGDSMSKIGGGMAGGGGEFGGATPYGGTADDTERDAEEWYRMAMAKWAGQQGQSG